MLHTKLVNDTLIIMVSNDGKEIERAVAAEVDAVRALSRHWLDAANCGRATGCTY